MNLASSKGMEVGISLGLQVNAGHGINYENVEGAKTLDQVTEFNIDTDYLPVFGKWFERSSFDHA